MGAQRPRLPAGHRGGARARSPRGTAVAVWSVSVAVAAPSAALTRRLRAAARLGARAGSPWAPQQPPPFGHWYVPRPGWRLGEIFVPPRARAVAAPSAALTRRLRAAARLGARAGSPWAPQQPPPHKAPAGTWRPGASTLLFSLQSALDANPLPPPWIPRRGGHVCRRGSVIRPRTRACRSLACCLPRRWGVDARVSARRGEAHTCCPAARSGGEGADPRGPSPPPSRARM